MRNVPIVSPGSRYDNRKWRGPGPFGPAIGDVRPVSGFERWEDDPDAPYYRSQRRNLTPAQTWSAIAERIA